MQNQFRYLARFTIETNTPLSIGSGRGGLLNQRLIAKDANGLPYIPGTALAGVVRHELAKQEVNHAAIEKLFGYQRRDAKDNQGSRIDFSSAHLLAEDGQTVLEGLCEIDFSQAYYQNFKRLPERDHVRIDHRGVAVKHNKFEEELVHRGTRFVFELELQGTAADKTNWQIILGILNAPMFRVGAGTRKGFGQFKVINCMHRAYDLSQKEALLAYLGKSSSLNQALQGWSIYQSQTIKNTWTTYSITLKARDFFLYSAGTGNKHADVSPKKEKIFVWPEQGSPQLEDKYLLPATSIKGALAHRVAYHYNLSQKCYVETVGQDELGSSFDLEKALSEFKFNYAPEDLNYGSNSTEWQRLKKEVEAMDINNSSYWRAFEAQLTGDAPLEQFLPVGEKNLAIQALFGFAKNKENGARGNVILSDCYLNTTQVSSKVFNHVAIDRFTGGARDGALFSEEVNTTDATINLEVHVEAKQAFANPSIKSAFEASLDDLCAGRLQLGGSINKGHGVFQGSWTIKTDEQ